MIFVIDGSRLASAVWHKGEANDFKLLSLMATNGGKVDRSRTWYKRIQDQQSISLHSKRKNVRKAPFTLNVMSYFPWSVLIYLATKSQSQSQAHI